MMPPRRVCCNPFKKNKHAQIFKGIRKITSNAKNCCLSFLGKYLCNCCRIQLSKTADEKQVVVKPRQDLTTDLQLDVVSSESDSDWEEEFFGDMKNNRENIADDGKLVEEIKRALDKAQTKQEKLKLLSTVPRSWGVNNIHATLGVSHHMTKNALKIRAALGYGCSPSKNRGRALPKELIKKVHDFYQDDSNSRVMPGQRDYLSVTIDGKKDRVQKRLLLFDLKELHYNFQARHPEVKLSCSKFCKLRPPFCVTVGCSGAHNVCVCKIHQNLKLMFCGLNKELEKDYAIADVIKDMVCPSPDDNCFLLQCKSCPGISIAANPIKKQMETQQVQYVHFKNWTCTDRCDIVEKKEEADTFYQTLQVDVPLYMRHDFVARSQSYAYAINSRLRLFYLNELVVNLFLLYALYMPNYVF